MKNDKDIKIKDNEMSAQYEDKDDPKYRGKVLMQRALDELDKGNIKEFETDRALANQYFDEISPESAEMDALYNESRNFGIIYNVIEENVNKLLETEDGIKSLRRIVRAIKGNKVIHEQFKAYNNLMPSNHVSNVNEYINEAISIIPRFSKEDIKYENEKLIRLIKEEKLDELIDIDDDKIDLYEAIEYVITNPKKLSNIDDFVNATNVIKEAIEKIQNDNKEALTVDDYTRELNKISESFGKELNSDELNLIKEVNDGNGEKLFNEHKTATLSKLNDMMVNEEDIDTKSRLSQIYEKISRKSYNKENAAVDISEMMEIQNTIDC